MEKEITDRLDKIAEHNEEVANFIGETRAVFKEHEKRLDRLENGILGFLVTAITATAALLFPWKR